MMLISTVAFKVSLHAATLEIGPPAHGNMLFSDEISYPDMFLPQSDWLIVGI